MTPPPPNYALLFGRRPVPFRLLYKLYYNFLTIGSNWTYPILFHGLLFGGDMSVTLMRGRKVYTWWITWLRTIGQTGKDLKSVKIFGRQSCTKLINRISCSPRGKTISWNLELLAYNLTTVDSVLRIFDSAPFDFYLNLSWGFISSDILFNSI